MATPFNNYTTKAKEAVHRAHQLAVERGHNQVSTLHLLAALLMQEESMVLPMLEQIEIDTAHLMDSVLEMIEGGSGATAVTLVPSMATDAAPVPMLQRSPSYIVTLPGTDPIPNVVRPFLPPTPPPGLIPTQTVPVTALFYRLSPRAPHFHGQTLQDENQPDAMHISRSCCRGPWRRPRSGRSRLRGNRAPLSSS